MDPRRRRDRLIAATLALRYRATEPYMLKLARLLRGREYRSADRNPLVSFTVPTYNRGRLLVERTLPAVLGQEYKNIEVVIVGDGCTDDTERLVRSLRDPRVRFCNLRKRGRYPSDVRERWFVAGAKPANVALRLARGAWLAWLDDDDVVLPDHTHQLLEYAQKGNYEFVAALYEAVRDGQLVVSGQRKEGVSEYGGHSTWLYRSYLRFFRYNIHSWRKRWDCPTDIDLQLRMRMAGVRMGALDRVVTQVLPRNDLPTVGLAAHLLEARGEVKPTT